MQNIASKNQRNFLSLFLAFGLTLFLSACGGGGGGGTTTGAATGNTAAATQAEMLTAMGTMVTTKSVPAPMNGGTSSCQLSISYAADGTFREDAVLTFDGQTVNGVRTGTWSIDTEGVLTTSDKPVGSVTALTAAELTVYPGTINEYLVSCSDGDHYSKDLGGNQLTWKKLVTVSGSSLTVTTKELNMNAGHWIFFRLDSTTDALEGTYVVWYQDPTTPGYNEWKFGANGAWSIKGIGLANASGTWAAYDGSGNATTSASSGNIQLNNIVSTSGSSWMDFTHSSSSWFDYLMTSANYGTSTVGNQAVVTWTKQ